MGSVEIVQLAIAFASASLLTAGITPLAARAAARVGLVSRPRRDRWEHRPTPLLGGVAMAAGILVALAFAPEGPVRTVLYCAFAAFALGLLDDFRHLAPTTKLVGQVLVGSALYLGGVRVEIVTFAPAALLLTVFWVVAVMNALNLMDNMDGLAAGITFFAAITLTLTAWPEARDASFVAIATAGGALGFLIYNFPPARIFMGDAGSQLLGLLLAAAALLHTASGATNAGLALLGPLAALALPIFDTTLVAASRRLAGKPVTRGGKDHASHRLAALGLSDRGTVLLLYAVAIALGGLGVLADAAAGLVVPFAALAAIGLLLFGVFLHEVDVYGSSPSREGPPETPRRALVREFVVYGRFGSEIALDALLLTVAYFTAFLLRFEGQTSASWMGQFTESSPIVVGAQLTALVVVGVYRTLWRYIGVSDAIAIVRAVALGTGGAALLIVVGLQLPAYSRTVFVLDGVLAASFVIGARSFLLWLRHWFASRPRADEVRVLIVGANEGGAFASRLLARSTASRYRVVGFLDDDAGKRHRSIGGIPIVGMIDELEVALALSGARVVVLTDGRHGGRTDGLKAKCAELGIEIKEVQVV